MLLRVSECNNNYRAQQGWHVLLISALWKQKQADLYELKGSLVDRVLGQPEQHHNYNKYN